MFHINTVNIDNLSKNKNIVILKQNKRRRFVVLDTTKYLEKCMALLNIQNASKELQQILLLP